jgi:hypothetical protein
LLGPRPNCGRSRRSAGRSCLLPQFNQPRDYAKPNASSRVLMLPCKYNRSSTTSDSSRENSCTIHRLGRRPTDLLRKSADERLPIDLLPLALHPVGGTVVKQQEALHMHRDSANRA